MKPQISPAAIAAMMAAGEQLVVIGGQVKSLGDGKYRAPLIQFTSETAPDLTGEYFTGKTNYWKQFPCEVPVIYSHGQDPTLKLKTIGKSGTATLTQDEAGIWMEGQLDLSDAYEAKISAMIDAGKMFTSSGSAGHMVTKTLSPNGLAVEITSWPIVEGSLTPTPAEHRNKVMTLKALKASMIGVYGSYGFESSWFDPDEDARDPVAEMTCAAADSLNWRMSVAIDNILTAESMDKAAKVEALRGIADEFGTLLVRMATLLLESDESAADASDVLKALIGRRNERPDSIKSFEKLLRDAGGFSRKEATVIASGGYKALQSDSGQGAATYSFTIDDATRKQFEYELMQLETAAYAAAGDDV